MADPIPQHPPEAAHAEAGNVIHLASFRPDHQLPLNDREIMFLRTLIANHADLLAVLLDTKQRVDKIATGCPVARRVLMEP